jgi:serine/threonine protein kinase
VLFRSPDFETCTRDIYPDDRRFRISEVLGMISALCSAARHLHGQGIAHGDFYAHNILRNDAGECLLGDFGAASRRPGEADLERIEVRAFGCLLEELLTRAEIAAGEAEPEAALWELHKRCNTEVVKNRPGFDEIQSSLNRLECGG